MLSAERMLSAAQLASTGMWAEYEAAFPREERRSWLQHCKAMENSDFFCMLLRHAGEPVCLLFYWRFPQGVYVEHLAVCSRYRGQGWGHKALTWLQQQGEPIILEIEPPLCPQTQRRLRFYASAGFVELPYAHVQPPYHADTPPVPLRLMSFPHAWQADAVAAFEGFLREHVMRYSDAVKE